MARYPVTVGGDKMVKFKGSRVLTKAESPLECKQLEGKTHVRLVFVTGGLTDHPPRPPRFAQSL